MSDGERVLALPAIVPVFPLTGALLLPRARLPLHIFEPRYRAMTADALAEDGMIAMAQPLDPNSEDDNPELYPVACLGRIVEDERLEDGRFLLTLEGVIRLKLSEELPLKDGYRRARADYGAFADDVGPAPDLDDLDREGLLAAFASYLENRGLKADHDTVARLPNEPLVNALAMACPFAPAEKQALLQAASGPERAEMLRTLMELAATPIAANDDEPPTLN